jgi:hypothetical protein
VSRRHDADGVGAVPGRAGSRRRSDRDATRAPVPRRRLREPSRGRSRGALGDLRGLSHQGRLPRVPPAHCGSCAGLPPRGLSRSSPRRGLLARDAMQRLPQCGVLLRYVPRAGGPRRTRPARDVRLSRRQAVLRTRARTSGAAGSRILYRLPRRARLPHLPFGTGRPALQSPRARVRCRAVAPQESADVHRLPRHEHPAIGPSQEDSHFFQGRFMAAVLRCGHERR